MLTGLPPFYSKDREKLFKNIKTGNLKYPVYLSKDALNLLQVFLYLISHYLLKTLIKGWVVDIKVFRI